MGVDWPINLPNNKINCSTLVFIAVIVENQLSVVLASWVKKKQIDGPDVLMNVQYSMWMLIRKDKAGNIELMDIAEELIQFNRIKSILSLLDVFSLFYRLFFITIQN